MKYLDLDAIHEDMKDISIRLAGADHKLVPLSFVDYVANQRTIQSLQSAENALDDVERQMMATVEMVQRSFPTAPIGELRKLTPTQLNKLLHFTRQANGDAPADPEPAKAPAEKAPAGEAPAGEAPSIGSENPTSA